MKKNEVAFLAAVLAFGALFSAVSVSRIGKRGEALAAAVAGRSEEASLGTSERADRPGSGRAPAGSARPKPPQPTGKSRDVDMSEFRRLIRSGQLSDHEAEFYGKPPAPAAGHVRPRTPEPPDLPGLQSGTGGAGRKLPGARIDKKRRNR